MTERNPVKTSTVTDVTVVPLAGHDSMLLNLSGAHGPFFTRNLVILQDSAGNTGVGEVPGGEVYGAVEAGLFKVEVPRRVTFAQREVVIFLQQPRLRLLDHRLWRGGLDFVGFFLRRVGGCAGFGCWPQRLLCHLLAF